MLFSNGAIMVHRIVLIRGLIMHDSVYVILELIADDLERWTPIRVMQRYSLRMDELFLYYPHRNVSPALRIVIDTLKI